MEADQKLRITLLKINDLNFRKDFKCEENLRIWNPLRGWTRYFVTKILSQRRKSSQETFLEQRFRSWKSRKSLKPAISHWLCTAGLILLVGHTSRNSWMFWCGQPHFVPTCSDQGLLRVFGPAPMFFPEIEWLDAAKKMPSRDWMV